MAAAAIIAAKGHAALTARDVASACRVSPGTIYNYFESFEEIVAGVRGQVLAELVGHLADAADPSPAGPHEVVGELARRYLAFATERPHLWAMVVAIDQPAGRRRRSGPHSPMHAIEDQLKRALSAYAQHETPARLAQIARSLAAFLHAQAAVATHTKMGVAFDQPHGFGHEFIEQLTRGLARSRRPTGKPPTGAGRPAPVKRRRSSSR